MAARPWDDQPPEFAWSRWPRAVANGILILYALVWTVWFGLAFSFAEESGGWLFEEISPWEVYPLLVPPVAAVAALVLARWWPKPVGIALLVVAGGTEVARQILVHTGHDYWRLHDTRLAVWLLAAPVAVVGILFVLAARQRRLTRVC